MKLVQKVKKVYNVLVGNTAETKMDIVLNHLIDTIELKGDMVHIKTKKNIILENDGHIVTLNSGMNVTIAKQIHLNPKINFKDKNFDELKPRLDEERRLEQIKFDEKMKQGLLQRGH